MGFQEFWSGDFGRESWGTCWSLGLEGREVVMGTIGFEEAMIMLAMAFDVVASDLIN